MVTARLGVWLEAACLTRLASLSSISNSLRAAWSCSAPAGPDIRGCYQNAAIPRMTATRPWTELAGILLHARSIIQMSTSAWRWVQAACGDYQC